ncbi:hypothetical protein J2Z34_002109 [Youngiibacter multivorans]|uniref:Uncharacterized protein n=1 Tax=Youngiibacter multivorans TaxID=937251 RepID=A0ABS4G512_9CLOT|nr:hypothetical protein [Youngiibacter multivorans]
MDNFKPIQFSLIGSMLEIDSNRVIDISWRFLHNLRSLSWFVRMEASYRYEDYISWSLFDRYTVIEKRQC